MKLTLKNTEGNPAGELEVSFPFIENGKGTQAVHDAIVAYNAAQRSGTACTKNVGEVAGTNKKPWRQKGTGRARAGSFASPLWRGGGVVFGPKPRDFSLKISKKTRQLALRKALSERLKSGDITLLSELVIDSPKTKDFLRVRKALDLKGTTLIVTDAIDPKLLLASRNISDVEVTTSQSLNVYQVLRSDHLVFTRSAFQQLESRMANEKTS